MANQILNAIMVRMGMDMGVNGGKPINRGNIQILFTRMGCAWLPKIIYSKMTQENNSLSNGYSLKSTCKFFGSCGMVRGCSNENGGTSRKGLVAGDTRLFRQGA